MTMQEVINSFQSFLSNSVDAFLECDRQQKYLSINPVAAAWMGLEPAAIVNKTHQELLKLYPNNPALKNIISQIDSCLPLWRILLHSVCHRKEKQANI